MEWQAKLPITILMMVDSPGNNSGKWGAQPLCGIARSPASSRLCRNCKPLLEVSTKAVWGLKHCSRSLLHTLLHCLCIFAI